MSREDGLLTSFLIKERLRHALPYLRNRKVLDVGTNRGQLYEFLSKPNGFVGIDLHQLQDLPFPFFKRSALDDLSDLGKFDAVALLAVIEHVREYEAMIANLAKVLSPGGLLVVTTPSPLGGKLHDVLAPVGIVSLEAAEDHVHIFSLDELACLMDQSGLSIRVKKTFLWGSNQLVVGEKPI